MRWLEILLIGISLSMDALAVALALGAAGKKDFSWRKIALTALFFGGFQALMPLAGWFGGSCLGDLVKTYGRVIASLLLAVIGGKMIWDRNEEKVPEFGLWKLTALAFATSIDALLVGVGFACLGRTSVWGDVLMIGATTAVISVAGCVTGRRFGAICGNRCELVGGLVLIGIALKVLLVG